MRLMTETEVKSLPALYQTEDTVADEKVVLIRFYELNSGWQWFLCEYSSEDQIAFGYVMGHENEWGYFSLEEMEGIHTILRDKKFQPMMFKDLKR
jgi:hypothetical protein